MLKIFVAITAAALTGLGVSTVEARPEYAQKMASPCRACHLKATKSALNEAGKAYKRTLGKEAEPVSSAGRQPAGASPVSAARDAAPLAPSVKKDEPVEPEDASEESEGEAEEKPAVVPLKTYRWQTGDGVMVFSDLPRDAQPSPVKKLRPKTSAKQPTAAAPVVARSIKPAKTSSAQPPQSGRKKESYGECIERMLADQPVPATADDLMDILIAAEASCSPAR